MELQLDLSIEIEGYEDLIREDRIRKYVESVLSSEYKSDKPVYLSIAFTDNKEIQTVNRDYRKIDAPTDVISFAYHESDDYDVGPYDTLGDIVISVERVVEQASEYGHSEERELFYVITHGLLHLMGYDHIDPKDKEVMRAKEEEILKKFGYTRDN